MFVLMSEVSKYSQERDCTFFYETELLNLLLFSCCERESKNEMILVLKVTFLYFFFTSELLSQCKHAVSYETLLCNVEAEVITGLVACGLATL